MREPAYIDMFHGANNIDAMPVHHVNGPRPPMLLVTGQADDTVAPHNSDDMAGKLESFASPVRVIRYPGIGHTGVILSLVPGFRGTTSLRQDMLDFIHVH